MKNYKTFNDMIPEIKLDFYFPDPFLDSNLYTVSIRENGVYKICIRMRGDCKFSLDFLKQRYRDLKNIFNNICVTFEKPEMINDQSAFSDFKFWLMNEHIKVITVRESAKGLAERVRNELGSSLFRGKDAIILSGKTDGIILSENPVVKIRDGTDLRWKWAYDEGVLRGNLCEKLDIINDIGGEADRYYGMSFGEYDEKYFIVEESFCDADGTLTVNILDYCDKYPVSRYGVYHDNLEIMLKMYLEGASIPHEEKT